MTASANIHNVNKVSVNRAFNSADGHIEILLEVEPWCSVVGEVQDVTYKETFEYNLFKLPKHHALRLHYGLAEIEPEEAVDNLRGYAKHRTAELKDKEEDGSPSETEVNHALISAATQIDKPQNRDLTDLADAFTMAIAPQEFDLEFEAIEQLIDAAQVYLETRKRRKQEQDESGDY